MRRLDIYRTKSAAVAAFIAVNPRQCEGWGLDIAATGGEYDAINERYELRGRKRVITLRAAIAACIPTGRLFSLARMDLDTLNDTGAAREMSFVLPDDAAVAKLEARPLWFGPYGELAPVAPVAALTLRDRLAQVARTIAELRAAFTSMVAV